MLRAIIITIAIAFGGASLFTAYKIRGEDRYPRAESNDSTCLAFANAPSKERERIASRLLRETLDADNGSGIAAAVVVNGELIWSDAAGHADRRFNAPLSTRSRMRIGSVSKPVTAALAAKLAEAGVLDLDAPIQKYVPEFPQSSAPITIRMLGSHLSGMRHYDFANFDEANNRLHFDDLSEALELIGANPFEAEPGEKRLYSSFGYNLIGAAIENATGKTFARALRDQLAEPLKLESLTVDNPTLRTPCRARFYTVYFGKLIQNTIWRNHSEAYPSAGVLISASDLAKFADAVFTSDAFSQDLKSSFMTPGRTRDGEDTDYSFGWHIDRNENGEIVSYSHGGFTNGAYAELRYYPNAKTAIAAITNYNLWLTKKQPAFDSFAQSSLPSLFIDGL